MSIDRRHRRRCAVAVALALGLALAGPGAASPGAASSAPRGTTVPACGSKRYRVKRGDTLWSIARRLGVGVDALAAANGLDPQAILPAGLVLVVPEPGCEERRADPARDASGDSSLADTLAHATATRGIRRADVGVVVVDLDRKTVVYGLNAEAPLEPASTEKLPLATAALQRLGAGFRTTTDVLGEGRLAGSTWSGDLILEGHGDPTLSSAGLRALAHAVRARGITAVSGRIVGDESYFDSARTAPGWKPSFAKDESPLLSALVVDRGVLDGHAVDHPALAAAILFTRALERAGVSVAGEPAVGTAAPGAVELTRRASPRLITMLSQMDTWSDNFIAEMLLKQLGARLGASGSTAAGAQVVAATLAADDVPLAGVSLADGSGLSLLDRLTARTLAATLETIWDTPALQPLLGTFAVAGSTGTLRHRLLDVPGHELVRGKTGTTDGSSALAGLVGSRFAFAVLCNGSPVDVTAAHQLQDRVAETLVAAAG